MDKGALLALISNLEKWALFFGILVAIGVAGESVYGIRLYWNNRTENYRTSKIAKLPTSEKVSRV